MAEGHFRLGRRNEIIFRVLHIGCLALFFATIMPGGVDSQTRLGKRKHPASCAFRNYFNTSIDYNDNMNVSAGAPGP